MCRFRVISGHLDDRRLVTTGRDPCLSQDERQVVSLNETPETLGFGFVCSSNTQTGDVRGHINWFPVTATGQVRWHAFSGGVGEDYDLTFDLAPPAPNATTSGNERAKNLGDQPVYHLEMYKRETLDSLPSVPSSVPVSVLSWWHLLKRSLRDEKQMRRLVDGRFAIVTGLFSLDGIHEFQAELHPVLAMAVLQSVGPTGDGKVREEWAVLVRNRGNEGECAIGRLPLGGSRDSLQTFLLDLGVWDGAGTPQVRLGPSWSWGIPAPRFKRDREHLYIAFTLPGPGPASPPSLFLGTVIVEWPSPGSGDPMARLERWRPPQAPTPTVERLKPDSFVASIGQTGMKLLPGQSGSRVLGDTGVRDPWAGWSRLPEARLEPLDSVWEVRRRTEATLAHLVSAPVTDFCAQADDWDNPACTSKFRLIGGVTTARAFPGLWPFFGSGYWLPRGLGFMKHIPLVGEGLYGLGWRLDVRTERFAESCRTTCSGASARGRSVRGSAQFAPNHLSLFGVATLTPYFNVGAGAYWPEGRRVNGTWNVGFGTEVQTLAPRAFPVLRTIFVELQNYLSGGGLQSHWSFNVGSVISLRPAQRLMTGR